MLEMLPAKLERMMCEHPLIRIDVTEYGSLDIPLLLLEGRADVGIVDITHAPHGIRLSNCFSDTLVLVVPVGHRLAGAGPIAFADTLDEDYVTLHDATALSTRLSSSASMVRRTLKVRMQMHSFDAVCRMVAGGLGIAVLPLEAVMPQLTCLPLVTVALTDSWVARTHRIALREEAQPSPATLTLIECLVR